MITIIHGDDIATSRNFYISQKQKNKQAISFDGRKITVTDLVQQLEGGELFSDSKTVFIEQLFSDRRKSKEFDQLLQYIKSQEKENDIILWEGKELTKAQIGTFKNAKINNYALPKELFVFLEGIRPQNKQLLKLFHNALKQTEVDLLFFMIVRQIRLLLGIKTKAYELEELKRTAPWQLNKLEKQSSYFSEKQLVRALIKLYEIDTKVKTGTSPVSLEQSIDIFLLDM